MTPYVALVLLVLGVNLMPAFGPPTWLVLVIFRLHEHMPTLPLVVLGAASSTVGRLLLAQATSWFSRWLPPARVANLRAAGELLQRRPAHTLLGLGLFLLSPLPSAQMFEAAGVMRIALKPIAAAFFLGRLVTYTLYVDAARVVDKTFGGSLRDSFTSWPSVVLQATLIIAIWLLSRIDWVARLKRSRSTGSAG